MSLPLPWERRLARRVEYQAPALLLDGKQVARVILDQWGPRGLAVAICSVAYTENSDGSRSPESTACLAAIRMSKEGV